MKNILVLGSSGMVGHTVSLFFKENGYNVSNVAYPNKAFDTDTVLDVRDIQGFKAFLRDKQPDVIINCIALLVQDSVNNKSNGVFINSFFPQWLGEECTARNIRLIHLSSFGVFDGVNAPFNENSPLCNQSFYGQTKILGEVKTPTALTVRSDYFGMDMNKNGTGLLNWFFQQKGEVFGYSKAKFSGVTSLELAKFLVLAVENGWTGIYNLTAKTPTNKYLLLKKSAEVFGLTGVTVKEKDTEGLDFTCVTNRNDIAYNQKDYNEMLIEMRDFANGHARLYSHYGFIGKDA